MKLFIQFLLILILSYFAGVFFPFWALAIAAFFITALIKSNVWASFIIGFLAIFLLWAVQAYMIDSQTASILTVRVALIFSVSHMTLMLITAVIGGLLGGLSAATGSIFRALFERKSSKYV